MKTVLILIGIIILVSSISFLVIKSLIKKNKSLQFKLDYAEKHAEQTAKNIKNYKLIIEKLNKKKVESEEVKNNISNATGHDLARLANSL